MAATRAAPLRALPPAAALTGIGVPVGGAPVALPELPGMPGMPPVPVAEPVIMDRGGVSQDLEGIGSRVTMSWVDEAGGQPLQIIVVLAWTALAAIASRVLDRKLNCGVQEN